MMKTVEQLAQSTNPAMVRAFGAIRRFVITLTDSAIWQIAGVLMPDGREAMRAEVFGAIGLHARPPSDVEAEVITVMVGDATNPTIVGMRDEQTRAAIVGDLKPNETAVYNSLGLVYVKDDGTIEVRSKNGTAVSLALKSDVEAVDGKYASHIHADSVGGPTQGPVSVLPPNPTGPPYPSTVPPVPLAPADIKGTDVLKGE